MSHRLEQFSVIVLSPAADSSALSCDAAALFRLPETDLPTVVYRYDAPSDPALAYRTIGSGEMRLSTSPGRRTQSSGMSPSAFTSTVLPFTFNLTMTWGKRQSKHCPAIQTNIAPQLQILSSAPERLVHIHVLRPELLAQLRWIRGSGVREHSRHCFTSKASDPEHLP